jgi:hypothetical protein
VGLANERNAAQCEIPSEFFEVCPNIEFFNVSSSNIIGKIPETVACCKKLRMFFVQCNSLSGEVPASALASITTLTMIGLWQNPELKLSKEGMELIKGASPNVNYQMDESQLG